MSGPRIAYLVKKFPRLSETFVLGEILGQEALGADIQVFSRRPPDAEPVQPQFAQLRATVECLPHPTQIDVWAALFGADGAALVERLQRALVRWRPLRHPRLPSLVAEALWLLERTRALGIEHVHAHFATDSALTAHLLHSLGGPGYSLTAHAKDIYRSTVDPNALRLLVEGSRFTVTVCDANVAHVARLIGSRAATKLRRLYNGVDIDRFAPNEVGESSRDPATVLTIGRLVEKKGFDVLLDALALLRERRVPLTAVLIGDGEDRDALHARAARLGLQDSIRWLGAVDQSVVRAQLRSATVFCLPCKIGADGNRDALPTVLLEAIASGLPTISTPVTGIPEILDHGRAGVLVPEDDVAATARAIEDLLTDAPRRMRLARAGRARAEACFDAKASARTLHGWFQEARHAAALEVS